MVSKIRTVGSDYIIVNLLVVFGSGAAFAGITMRVFYKNSFIELFLCMSLLFAIAWFLYNINTRNPKSVFYRVIDKTINKNIEKYGFENAYICRGYSGTILIDTAEGRIAYLSNMNPWKFQLISAGPIGKISVSHVPYLTHAFTTYVFFQFYHRGKKIRIPTYATNGKGRSVENSDVKRGFSEAEKGAENLREAKQAALMREGKKRIDHNSIVPSDMWEYCDRRQKAGRI